MAYNKFSIIVTYSVYARFDIQIFRFTVGPSLTIRLLKGTGASQLRNKSSDFP